MQDQPSSDGTRLFSSDQIAGAVLSMLLEAHPGQLSIDELARKFAGFSGDPKKARVAVEDGLSDLKAHGLVHRLGEMMLASQAAARGQALRNY